MVNGFMRGNIPLIVVTVVNKSNILDITFTLDTGFTEDLLITKEIANELEITPESYINIQNANGQTVGIDVSYANSIIENEKKEVQVFISDGLPLLGIGFLTKFGYRAIIDCKKRTVTLEK
jgi:clan AA aspartic protease